MAKSKFEELLAGVKASEGQYQRAKAEARKAEQEFDAAKAAYSDYIKENAGIRKGDLVQDDMGVIYRVTRVLPPRYGSETQNLRLSELIAQVQYQGIALNEQGLPRWTQARTILGKISAYTPG